jgi:4-hydroxy-tetrahydrodipicolinate synthase
MFSSSELFSGVLVATVVPFDADGNLLLDRYAEHLAWLRENGCRGVATNGSLGEYASLTLGERRDVVKVAVEQAGADFVVVAGVAAPGGDESYRLAHEAGELGAHAVMALPPTIHRATGEEVVAHYARIAAAGLPICVYNNPIDTKVDLSPALIGRLAEIPEVVAVKEFSGDVRRFHEIAEVAPDLLLMAGADDLLLEAVVCGAVGWLAGFPNAFPAESVQLFDLCRAGKVEDALALYRALLPAFRWDSRTEFVQAIKLGMDMVGRFGGPSRLPRLPLPAEVETRVRADMDRALEALQG